MAILKQTQKVLIPLFRSFILMPMLVPKVSDVLIGLNPFVQVFYSNRLTEEGIGLDSPLS